MHPRAADLIVESVRRRVEQGDCPTEPTHGYEILEATILELASRIRRSSPSPAAAPSSAGDESEEHALLEYRAACEECVRSGGTDNIAWRDELHAELLARLRARDAGQGTTPALNMEHITRFLVSLPPLPVIPEVDRTEEHAKFAFNVWSEAGGKIDNFAAEIYDDGHIVWAGPKGHGKATNCVEALASITPQLEGMWPRSSSPPAASEGGMAMTEDQRLAQLLSGECQLARAEGRCCGQPDGCQYFWPAPSTPAPETEQ